MFVTFAASCLIGAVVLLVDLIIGIGLLVKMISALQLAARGVTTTGTVVWVGDPRPGLSRKTRISYVTPRGKFETPGRTQTLRTGDSVTVRYHSKRPSLATANTRFWRQAITGIPTIAVSAVLSAGMVTGAVWYFSGTHAQIRDPLDGGCFVLLISIPSIYYATSRLAMLLRWRRMVRTDGEVLQYEDYRGDEGRIGRILISFQTADDQEEFWAQAGSAIVGSADEVTVYYDPSKPATSATVQSPADIRAHVIFNAVVALGFGILGIYVLATQL